MQGETRQDTLIKLAKIKDKEKLLKATRGKRQITYKGTPIRLTADFSVETLQARRDEREEPTTKITLPGKDLVHIRWRNQKLYRQAKAKSIQHHQTSSTTNAKGTSLSGKHKRRKGRTKTNPEQLRN